MLAVPLLLALAVQAGDKTAESTIVADDGVVLAGDIARTSPSAGVVVMTLPEGANSVELNPQARRELLRAAFPGGQFALRQDGAVRVVRRATHGDGLRQRNCFVSRSDIARGDAVDEGDLEPVTCRREMPGRWLGYDRESAETFARRAVPAGSYLGAVRLPTSVAAAKGAPVVYRISKGPVTVERRAVALQPGRAGRRMFVRTEDGKVLASAVAGDGRQ